MTTPENQNTNQQELEPFFPPIILFGISMIGFFVALVVLQTQQEFNIVGWAGLLVGIISFIFWVIMNPRAVLDFVRGRGLSFGGTAIVVSVILIVAASLVYMVVAAQDWTLDFTEGNVLTLSDDTREVLEAIANDPTQGNVRFVAFADSQNVTGQERMELLLRQFEDITNGKISYEFINPDREPLVVELYGENVRSGNVAVVLLDAEGKPILDDVELLTNPDQYTLTNMTIEVLADGDFRAVFLNVPEGADPADTSPQSLGSGVTVSYLRDTLGWTVDVMSPLELTTEAGIGDMAADGDVLIIPGGIDALSDDAVAAIAEYVNNGGNLILLAGPNYDADPTLAGAENMSTFLQETYGVSVRNDIVVDAGNRFTLQVLQLLADTYNSHPITQQAIANDNALTIFSAAQSIDVAATPPDGVTVTTLITTSDEGYSKAGLDITALSEQGGSMEELQALFAQQEGDISGALPLAVAADNANNGSRLVVFGSDALIWNIASGASGEANLVIMRTAIFWATRFDDFAQSLAFVQPVQDTPPDQVILQESDISYIRFVTMFLIPFGSLLIGVAIWWMRRERVTG